MLFRTLTALLFAGSMAAAWGQQGAAATPRVLDAPAMRALLQRIHQAAGSRNFSGHFVVSAGGKMSSAKISHFRKGPDEFERIESMDGEVRKIYRHNGLVHTFWPQKHIVVTEQREPSTMFPSLLQGAGETLADAYELQELGEDRVADHEAKVLAIVPHDKARYGYRLWADKSSDLLLRAEVLGPAGEVLESSAFTDVELGVKSEPDKILKSMNDFQGYRKVERKPPMAASLDSEGWMLKSPTPGFRLVSSVKRPLTASAEAENGAGQAVLQAVFTDGLCSVSVFIEDYDSQRHSREMQAASGATQTLMHKQDNAWVTLVGDVPPATLKAFAQALERRPR